MNNLEFIGQLKKNIGYDTIKFISVERPFFNCSVKFSNKHKAESWSFLMIDNNEKYIEDFFMFTSQEHDFDRLLNDFVENLKNKCESKQQFDLYVGIDCNDERRCQCICSNPKSLEDILIQSELNII